MIRTFLYNSISDVCGFVVIVLMLVPGMERARMRGTEQAPSEIAVVLQLAVQSSASDRNPLDTSNDHVISPIDVLIVVNELNRTGSRPIDEEIRDGNRDPFLDADGNHWLTPNDALVIITYLNSL